MRSTLTPWGARSRYEERLAGLLRFVRDRPLAQVRYEVSPGGTWPEGYRTKRVHEVELGVELLFAGGRALVFRWAMDGLHEGLKIEVAEGEPAEGEWVEVTRHADWLPFLGSSVTELVAAWHVPNAGSPELPWAFRLDFAQDLTLALGLGEAAATGFRYLPDSLLVFLDPELADTYRIPASSTSVLGR